MEDENCISFALILLNSIYVSWLNDSNLNELKISVRKTHSEISQTNQLYYIISLLKCEPFYDKIKAEI